TMYLSVTLFFIFLPFSTLGAPSSLPYNPSDINTPCGFTNPNCPDPLTCIPLARNCTTWTSEWKGLGSHPGCPGTCQYVDYSQSQNYTVCGGWASADDCYESREICIADPRTNQCGIPCDDKGLCHPYREMCGWDTGLTCPEGKVCFGDGVCLPLRFGSDSYKKGLLEEVVRKDQDGWNGDRGIGAGRLWDVDGWDGMGGEKP
ncbi:hypothetical protein QBC44DRAFT_228838, partial [Cladorrhinum sp. PSN332]